ncbi:MAG TPA: glutamine amidotransferase [Polyangiales bacterium]|nr:glutamine amidotransferase [Polyangiales bacterium]
MPRLLLLQVGHTFEEVARERGDYDRWFRHGLGLEEHELEVVRVFDGQPLPHGWGHDGIVVTGSWSMVTDREAWSEATAEYLREAVMRKRALLGVCYGHQLLAHALGGQVGYNPKGRHAGTDRIALTDEAAQDPLFESFASPLLVQVSHSQSVLQLPAEAVVLAHCAMDPHHAFRIGGNAWGVQFHPEFDGDVSRRYIELRRATIQAEGLDPDQLIDGIQESLHGRLLLRKFVQLL